MLLSLILAGVAFAGLAALGVWMLRSMLSAPPMPRPALRTLADWRREHEAALDARDLSRDRWVIAALDPRSPGEWVICACCGAPTYDPRGACGLCGWAEGEPLDRSRDNFARYGIIDTPEDMAQWGELPPTDDERAVITQVLELCARAPAGRQPGTKFWSEFNALMHTPERFRHQRFQAAQQPDASAGEEL